ncbi:hypothetical protein JJQ97_09030 [Pseudomonas syringae]|uniref:HEPN domain-containing protein n=1 Tax=Pseudomonas syringae TaxID=317 RepID=UPI0019179112|nr:HEPN domain-containing protein [Pseudomonas syringae]QQQ52336.1 hypothetical protein JJQ97_09030 [Pseudomonas syringae]
MLISSKQVRSAQKDLDVLLKSSELMNDVAALKSLEFMERLRREVSTPNGSKIYFSDKASQSFQRLFEIISLVLPSKDFLEPQDIYASCKTVLGRLYEQGGSESVEVYIIEVESAVALLVSDHDFYSVVAGLEFEGFDELEVGKVSVHRPRLEVLEASIAQDGVVNMAWREMNYGLWITTKITGSWAYGERRFFEHVKVTCGLLALALAFTTTLEHGGAAVRLIPSVEGRFRPGATTWFSVESHTNNLHLKTSYDGFQRLDLKHDYADSLLTCDWFIELTRIGQLDVGNDAEQAVRRGLYWFFDAQADNSIEMKFVKYWSCIECIFSIGKIGVTEKIRRGITSMLTYGGYRFSNIDEWEVLGRRISKLYDLRSSAVHDARHDHISMKDVVDVSKWSAFVIMEISMLIKGGLTNRKQLLEEVDRLQECHLSRHLADGH